MSRPKTKGPMIGVRLPFDVDAEIRAEANERGISPGLHIAGILTERSTTAVLSRDEPAAGPDFDELYGPCVHLNAKVTGGDVKRCSDCGALTNARGEWPS